jgi:hypothetical protein
MVYIIWVTLHFYLILLESSFWEEKDDETESYSSYSAGKNNSRGKDNDAYRYDYPMALLEEKAGIDIILCGDSMAMTVFGHESTLNMKMDTMI